MNLSEQKWHDLIEWQFEVDAVLSFVEKGRSNAVLQSLAAALRDDRDKLFNDLQHTCEPKETDKNG